MNESASLVLDDFANGRMVVADVNLSSVSLEVQVTIAFMIKKILKVSFSDYEGCFVVSRIGDREMLLSFGDDLIRFSSERLWFVTSGRQGKGRKIFKKVC